MTTAPAIQLRGDRNDHSCLIDGIARKITVNDPGLRVYRDSSLTV